jgi:hypothetical protein
VEDFGRYLYLPRLQASAVLVAAIRAGVALLTWQQDGFAYADTYDESAGRYRGLRTAVQITVTADDSGLLVRPEIARQQIAEDTAPPPPNGGETAKEKSKETAPRGPITDANAPPQPPKPRRYHGTVTLDPARVGRDAGKIGDEVVTHLVGLLGSSVRVTMEIEAEVPAGVPDNVVRIVTENSRSLKFGSNSGFEKE